MLCWHSSCMGVTGGPDNQFANRVTRAKPKHKVSLAPRHDLSHVAQSIKRAGHCLQGAKGWLGLAVGNRAVQNWLPYRLDWDRRSASRR